MESYNLLHEQWIPVLWRDGRNGKLNILEALSNAHLIRQFAATNPMDRLSLFRFLLAILYQCQGNPDGRNMPTDEPFPEGWFNKLNEKHFELFGDGQRFCQYLHKKPLQKKPITELYHELPSGTNRNHFRHTLDNKDGLCAECCAIGILRWPSWATQGGSGKSPGINSSPPFYIVPKGLSLASTLKASWEQRDIIGVALWEDSMMTMPIGKVSLMEGLTWNPRQIWLDNPSVQGNCSMCGNKSYLVMKCYFGGCGSSQGAEWSWTDPHVAYAYNKKGDRTSISPGNPLDSNDLVNLQKAIEIGSQASNKYPLMASSLYGMASTKTKFFDSTEYVKGITNV